MTDIPPHPPLGPWRIYVLRLAKGFWYVGKTRLSILERLAQHLEGGDEASAWTRLHEPLAVEDHRIQTSIHDEDNTVLDYMHRYGITRVRGGTYSHVDLSSADVVAITKHIDTLANRCYKCHQPGHFATKCTAQGVALRQRRREARVKRVVECTRCGRTGHSAGQGCYARWHARGHKLFDYDLDDEYVVSGQADEDDDDEEDEEDDDD
jgi:hypothetical protein